MNKLISPYGEKLVNLLAAEEESEELFDYTQTLPSIRLTERQMYDLELLATGAFSPLEGFMNQADYQSVLDNMRLENGYIFPIPITLSNDNSQNFQAGRKIALRDSRNRIVALIEITEIYEWNKAEAAQKVFGTNDSRHPLVAEMNRWGKYNFAGNLRVLQLPQHYDFQNLRMTPAQVREKLKLMNSAEVVAFQTRNPLHLAHEALVRKALEQTGGVLLLHPVIGTTKINDIDYHTRVRTYINLTENHLPPERVLLSLLPLAMRFAGPREAVWHALIRRNFGADNFIIGRSHAGPGKDSNGKNFYEPSAAQELAEQCSRELGVKILKFDEFVYLPETDEYREISTVSKGQKIFSLSGTQIREDYLKTGKALPEWFTRRETAEILSDSMLARYSRGICLWFTGLSGAGKSTTAEFLQMRLLAMGKRVTLLDGDIVRTHLSKGLSFSPVDRDTNVRRIGFVAGEIVKHGGIVICAAISPYRATRDDIRNLIGAEHFIEIFVQTPLEVCEERDTKGMYAQARKGKIKNFTGVNAPYENPLNPEITLDTVNHTVEENVLSVLNLLKEKYFL